MFPINKTYHIFQKGALWGKKAAPGILLPFLWIFSLLLLFSCTKGNKPEGQKESVQEDLFEHPLYKTYEFTENPAIIHLGMQPLYLPTGLLTEMVRRDLVLKKKLDRLGVQLKFFPFLKGDDINFFMARGRVHMAVGGDMPALRAASENDILIPLKVQQGFSSIISGRVMLTKELKKKKIGVPFGSISHYALLRILQNSGIREKDVTIIPTEVHELYGDLANKSIDAFSAWEPYCFEARKKNPALSVVGRTLTTGYLYLDKTAAEENEQAVLQILAAFLRALNWLKHDRTNLYQAARWNLEAMKHLTGNQSPLTDNELALLAGKDILQLFGYPEITAGELETNSTLNREFMFLQNLGKISNDTEWEKVKNKFDPGLLEIIIADEKTYLLHTYEYAEE